MVGSENLCLGWAESIALRVSGPRALSRSRRLVGFDPADFAAQVTHAIQSGGALLSRLKFIENLLPALCRCRSFDQWIGGGVAAADPMQRAVLLCNKHVLLDVFPADSAAQVRWHESGTFFLTRAGVKRSRSERRRSRG